MGSISKLEKRLLRAVGRANEHFGLLGPGMKVLACVSGGKDSMAMLHLLRLFQRRVPYEFQLQAVTLDQGQPGFDPTPLQDWMQAEGYDFRLLHQDTYSVVTDKLQPGETYCSLCSRLRRGHLYRVATESGADRIAFGHHRDDVIETLLLNLFYAGSIGAMAPRFRSDDGKNVMIRPLFYCAEEDLAALAEQQAFPVLPCGLCDNQPQLKRQEMKALLARLQADNPKVKGNMMAALGNLRPSHLLDERVRRATGCEDWTGP